MSALERGALSVLEDGRVRRSRHRVYAVVHYRFRLLDDAGNDLGPFATQRAEWRVGERLARFHGEEFEVVAVTTSEPGDFVVGYLVVRPVQRGRDMHQGRETIRWRPPPITPSRIGVAFRPSRTRVA